MRGSKKEGRKGGKEKGLRSRYEGAKGVGKKSQRERGEKTKVSARGERQGTFPPPLQQKGKRTMGSRKKEELWAVALDGGEINTKGKEDSGKEG